MGFIPQHLVRAGPQPGITILPLHINESAAQFTAGDNNIRIGLKQVAGMEAACLESILEEREKSKFSSCRTLSTAPR